MNQYLFLLKGTRCVVFMECMLYIKANSKYVKKNDPTKPSVYIPYLDTNNLYSKTLMEYFLWWIKVR